MLVEQYLPIAILMVLSIGLSVIVVFISTLFGPKAPTVKKLASYESGMAPIGPAVRRLPVKFNMEAVLFILFDVELIFLFPYAVLIKDLGAYGLIVVGVFVFILTVGFIYEWKRGALEWE